jgi:arsenate reductase
LKGDEIEAYSAGIENSGLNSGAVRVAAEAGVDISALRSMRLDELRGVECDYLVSIRDIVQWSCPVFPEKAIVIQAGFDAPPRLTALFARGIIMALTLAQRKTCDFLAAD